MACRSTSSRPEVKRRGVAAVALLVLMLVLGLIVAGMLRSGGRDHNLTALRIESMQAFYAAEAGMNMAIREAHCGCDEDLDGVAGTISDDSNDATDPQIGFGQVVVTQVVGGSSTTRTSDGRAKSARRSIDAAFE
jgi:Tfp pilus assembly protein PilX